MAPNLWLSLVLAPAAKDALQQCISQIQTTSPVPLDAMSHKDMHMTLVFMGSSSRSMLSAKRVELQQLMDSFTVDATRGTSLQFEAFELFPPTKRNLLIAKYAVQGEELKAVRKLQAECFAAGFVSDEEHNQRLESEFVAHVTLGKFRGMKADQSSGVQKAISMVNNHIGTEEREALELPFEAACLCGGG